MSLASTPSGEYARGRNRLWEQVSQVQHVSRLRNLALGTVITAAAVIGTPALAHADPALSEFTVSTGHSASQPVAGPDGDVWSLDANTGVGSVTPGGSFAFIPVGTPMTSVLASLDASADGSTLWVGDSGLHAIWRVQPDAAAGQRVTEFTAGLPAGASPQLLTAGSDGNQWFFDSANREIGRITPAGAVTMFSTGLNSFAQLNAMTPGPDGNLWFTDIDESMTPAVGRVTMAGVITEVPTAAGTMPDDITAGPDGNLWFTEDFGPISKIVPGTLALTTYSTGLQANADPDAITAGADGNVWFDDQYASNFAVGKVTPAGAITEYPVGDGLPVSLTAALDGNMWVAQGVGSDPATAPESVDRITTAGVVSRFSAGLHGTGIQDGDEIINGPDGNLWFSDGVDPKGVGKVALQIPPTASTGAASAVGPSSATIAGSVNPRGSASTVTVTYGTTPALGSSSSAVTLPASGTPTAVSLPLTGLPSGAIIYYEVVATNVGGTATGTSASFESTPVPSTTTTTTTTPVTPPPVVTVSTLARAAVGDQRLTLSGSPVKTCRAATAKDAVSLTATTLASGEKVHFVSAAFLLDRGVKHTRTVRKRVTVHGKTTTRTVTVVTYTANALARRLPAHVSLSLHGLARGSHTLKVTVTEHVTRTKTVLKKGRRVKVTYTATLKRTLSSQLTIC